MARQADEGSEIEYLVGDFLTHPFAPASSDAIISVAALHHMDAGLAARSDAPASPACGDAGRRRARAAASPLMYLSLALIVIGGGYVAMEQAQLFAHLGTQVTMLVRSRLARGEEPEIAAELKVAFEAEDIRVREGVQASAVRKARHGVIVTTNDGHEQPAEHVLVAAGRRPRTAGLGLDAVGVQVGPGGEVVVDDDLSTSNPRVWAGGDVTGHPQFVYVAAKHGALVVANAFEHAGRRISYRSLPRITFTNPTIASAGVTEAQALEHGIGCACRVLDLASVPRGIVSRNTRGVVKLVAERDSGRVIGVHMLADGAGDAILAGVYAIEANRTVAELAASWNPYLTIGEGLHLAAQAFTRDVSKLSCCAA